MKLYCDCGLEALNIPIPAPNAPAGLRVDVREEVIAPATRAAQVNHAYYLLVTCVCGRQLIAIEDHRRAREAA